MTINEFIDLSNALSPLMQPVIETLSFACKLWLLKQYGIIKPTSR